MGVGKGDGMGVGIIERVVGGAIFGVMESQKASEGTGSSLGSLEMASLEVAVG